jgi:glucosamine-phosphate N-acetyltransferase
MDMNTIVFDSSVGMRVIPLNSEHYEKYKSLLNQLSKTEFTTYQFINFIDGLHDKHRVYVLEIDSVVIGCVTLMIENKLIHNGGIVMHVEDLVISKEYRMYGFGSKILEFVKELAKELNCYKVILNCNCKVIDFYKKNGFFNENYQMVFRV